VSTKRSSASKKVVSKKVAAKPATPKASANAVLTTEEIKPILAKNTCLACHQVDKRQVGPAYKDIAARRYTAKQIVDLIRVPKPENWPGYSTEMPPMPQVSDEDAMKIANWIISLQEERP
jgi:cytochrome c551/c552